MRLETHNYKILFNLALGDCGKRCNKHNLRIDDFVRSILAIKIIIYNINTDIAKKTNKKLGK